MKCFGCGTDLGSDLDPDGFQLHVGATKHRWICRGRTWRPKKSCLAAALVKLAETTCPGCGGATGYDVSCQGPGWTVCPACALAIAAGD